MPLQLQLLQMPSPTMMSQTCQQSKAKYLYLDAESDMLEVQDAEIVLEHFPVDLNQGPLQ